MTTPTAPEGATPPAILPPMRAVRDRQRQPVKQGDTPTFQKVLDYQKVLRGWRPHLSRGEFETITYLVDRTAGMGCQSVDLTVGQMVAGDGIWPAIGMQERAVRKHLASLHQRGLITSRCTAGASTCGSTSTGNPDLN